MKVVHLIPSLKNVDSSAFLRYKVELIKSMSDEAEVTVLTSDRSKVSLGNARIEIYSPAMFVAGRSRKLNTLLADFNPDLVHIHAKFGMSAYILFRICRRRHIPVIVSADRQFEPWHAVTIRQKLLRGVNMSLMRPMFTCSTVLHSACRQEYDNLLKAGGCPLRHRPLNARTAEIDAFTITGTTTVSDMLVAMMALYRKAVDTYPFSRMSRDELDVEDKLIFRGVTDGRIAPPADGLAAIAGRLDGKAWRRISLHASDEGVTGLLLAGIRAAGLSAKIVDAASVSRFSTQRPAAECGMQRASRLIRRLEALGIGDGVERDVCASLITVAVKCRYASVRRSDFVKLYQTLRFNNYDEGRVAEAIAHTGLSKQCARLLCILGERYGLTEGYMYTLPLADEGTEKLRKKLFKSGIQ